MVSIEKTGESINRFMSDLQLALAEEVRRRIGLPRSGATKSQKFTLNGEIRHFVMFKRACIQA